MLNQVPLVKTTYSGEEIVKALIEAWQSLFGEVPSENVIGVLYAQNSQETGYSKSMYNNNIGNIKAVDRSVGTVNYMVIPGTWEILNGKKVVLAQDNPGSRFLAFELEISLTSTTFEPPSIAGGLLLKSVIICLI